MLRVYTDGSGMNRHVGAAAIVLNMPVVDIPAKRTEYMGTTTTSTPLRRPTPISISAITDVKRYNTSYLNVETGVKNDEECG